MAQVIDISTLPGASQPSEDFQSLIARASQELSSHDKKEWEEHSLGVFKRSLDGTVYNDIIKQFYKLTATSFIKIIVVIIVCILRIHN